MNKKKAGQNLKFVPVDIGIDTKKIKSYGYACDCNKHEIINYVERFGDTWFAPDSTWLAKNNLQAWWNSTRHTRGMSYDLRGDIPIPLPNTFYP